MPADKSERQKTFDRSVPRAQVAAGDVSTDRRERHRSAAAFLSDGFRPFFFLDALYAALAIPLFRPKIIR